MGYKKGNTKRLKGEKKGRKKRNKKMEALKLNRDFWAELKKYFGLKKKKTFWAECNIFGLNQKRIKQKKKKKKEWLN